MNKVFIVVEVIPYEGDTVLRVFANNEDAIAYGEQLVEDGVIEEFDVYEREVYQCGDLWQNVVNALFIWC